MKHINRQFINGQFLVSAGTERFQTFDPSLGLPISEVVMANEVDAQKAIDAAKAAFEVYSNEPKTKRIEYLKRLKDAFGSDREKHIELFKEEYGGPGYFGEMTVDSGIQFFQIAIDTLSSFSFETRVDKSMVVYDPVGVCALISPWNGVLWSVTMKLSQAIAAGCSVVIKPSEYSSLQADAIAETIQKADLPKGLVNVLIGKGEVVGPTLVKSPDVAKISFTGSNAVGEKVMRDGASSMKRLTLELGGKSPTIILDDSNLQDAVNFALQAGLMNSGQSCIAGTRILIPEARYEEFTHAFKLAAEYMTVGPSSNPNSMIGPMVSKRQFDRVRGYIRKGIEEGATLLYGGEDSPKGLEQGYFIKPTIFANVRSDMVIAREEIFGPVLCLIKYSSDEEAIGIANDSDFGLHAYIFGDNRERIAKIARRLRAGRVMINEFIADSVSPFGGYKKSGLGREFGVHGLLSFLEPKVLLEA